MAVQKDPSLSKRWLQVVLCVLEVSSGCGSRQPSAIHRALRCKGYSFRECPQIGSGVWRGKLIRRMWAMTGPCDTGVRSGNRNYEWVPDANHRCGIRCGADKNQVPAPLQGNLALSVEHPAGACLNLQLSQTQPIMHQPARSVSRESLGRERQPHLFIENGHHRPAHIGRRG